ncbi:MarR family winged helix-turn-helix transcriptional regulator [Gorillibacterium timonense]|uniref:MarR family winged helix-turn-helix transcriptional regulator n=1 Tax=Gorillibacterium timonense TaxID=1689269 RepID=UPI00071C86BB|nr:MarR family transcriptional regulator [Gorillibacterium timonense]
MDMTGLFRKFVDFTTAVHDVKYTLTKDVKAESLPAVQYRILEYLAVSPPVTPSEISECMHLSLPNTSRELRKLDEAGLCERIPDTEDRRKQYIRLSDKGTAMMEEAFAWIQVRFEERTGPLTDEEKKEIERALDLLQRKVFY